MQRKTPNADGSWTESVLHSFNGSASDGAIPLASVIFDAVGNLYGTTSGGDHSNGNVFELTPNADGSWTESVLHSFDGYDGSSPQAGLIFDAAGNLYGTAGGGAYGKGTVFKLTPNGDASWTESVLHSFTYDKKGQDYDGAGPVGLVFDAVGNLYGTSAGGGAYGDGTVFELTPNADGSWTESVLHSFNYSVKRHAIDGMDPEAGLIFDAAGNLYGTTYSGGASSGPSGDGTVFKLTPNAEGSWTESVVHNFKGNPARNPYAGLILDGSGNLYGTTVYGGSAGGGVVFRLSPKSNGTWTYSSIHVFQGTPAAQPYGGLVLGSADTLYGTTAYCLSGCSGGVVYEITP